MNRGLVLEEIRVCRVWGLGFGLQGFRLCPGFGL